MFRFLSFFGSFLPFCFIFLPSLLLKDITIDLISVWSFFAFYFGFLASSLVCRYLTRYGEKNLVIFGGLIFGIFTIQFLLAKAVSVMILMSIFAGFGYGFLYQMIVRDNVSSAENIKFTGFYNFFIVIFYCIFGIILFATPFKMQNLGVDLFYFIAFLAIFIAMLSLLFYLDLHKIFRLSVFYQSLLLLVSIWIIGLANDFIILNIGLFILVIAYRLIIKDSRILNIKMVVGFFLSAIIIGCFKISGQILLYINLLFTLCLLLYARYFEKLFFVGKKQSQTQ